MSILRFFFAIALLSAPPVRRRCPSRSLGLGSQAGCGRLRKVEAERLAAAQKHVDQLLAVTGTRTVENTLRPFDAALEQINSASYFAGLMQQVHPDAKFRDSATEMTRKASAAATALSLNRGVYQALGALDLSKADAATRHFRLAAAA